MQERQLELLKTSIYKIDFKEISANRVDYPEVDTAFYKYLRGSVNEVSIANGGRKFKLRSLNTEVVNTLIPILDDGDIDNCQGIASRLLREEVKAQERIQRLGKELSEGLLIISLIEDRGIKKMVLCKVEDLQYINRVTLSLASGYPLKRKIFRSVQFVLSDNNSIADIVVHDLNSKGATYWWDDFLELDQLWDDIYNTKTAFDRIDTKVLSKIKKESPGDHTYLRNATIKYFRTKQEFTIEDYIETCFEGYEPILADKVDIESLKLLIRGLPEKHSFDERFNLKPSEITAKIKSTINLTDNLDLIIKSDINIENTVVAEKINHRKFIRIRSDAGYDAFTKETS